MTTAIRSRPMSTYPARPVIRLLTEGGGTSAAEREWHGGGLLRHAAEPRGLRAAPRLGGVRRRLGWLAAPVPAGKPHDVRLALARALPDQSRLAIRLCGGRMWSGARDWSHGTKR